MQAQLTKSKCFAMKRIQTLQKAQQNEAIYKTLCLNSQHCHWKWANSNWWHVLKTARKSWCALIYEELQFSLLCRFTPPSSYRQACPWPGVALRKEGVANASPQSLWKPMQ
mmetsp:Transcript_108809/g.192701  ORF Transcript_108809/g.192701 Transcript_108809/m.192701 type:complete len:111 (-) Transcript_108809:1381-1713(-)